MILIFSKAEDYTTMEVVRWIKYLNKDAKFARINADKRPEGDRVSLTPDDILLVVDDQAISLKEVTSVWYRKGLNYLSLEVEPEIPDNEPLTEELQRIAQRDVKRVREYIHHVIKDQTFVLGAYGRGNLNKLIVLSIAREVGLMTPNFVVGNDKRRLQAFVEGQEGAITKAISDGLYLFDDKTTFGGYFNYTSRVSTDDLADDEDVLPLSLVQNMVVKRFEVRTVFLDGVCYSTAIFSQSDAQTEVDYRRYNAAKPNRTVPFQLPRGIEEKLTELFVRLGLNTGSVDFIVDDKGAFIFLEINPVGQFGPHSLSCNYGLEQRIAEVLLEQR